MPTLALMDQFGRTARDLRVSLTDRCNLRCVYCMPAEGLEWLPTEETLTNEEVIRLITIAVEQAGIEKLRFTGGEPLLRKGLEEIIEASSALRTKSGKAPDIALTTNALGLDKRLPKLQAAGLQRVNISLDSLDPKRYAQLTRRDRFQDVMSSITAVADAGMLPLKLNTLILRGQNEADILPLADFALRRGFELRFIEQMPLGPKHSWDRNEMVSRDEILAELRTKYHLTALANPDTTAPAGHPGPHLRPPDSGEPNERPRDHGGHVPLCCGFARKSGGHHDHFGHDRTANTALRCEVGATSHVPLRHRHVHPLGPSGRPGNDCNNCYADLRRTRRL